VVPKLLARGRRSRERERLRDRVLRRLRELLWRLLRSRSRSLDRPRSRSRLRLRERERGRRDDLVSSLRDDLRSESLCTQRETTSGVHPGGEIVEGPVAGRQTHRSRLLSRREEESSLREEEDGFFVIRTRSSLCAVPASSISEGCTSEDPRLRSIS
jgi:hypothetical protein